MGRLFGTDGIRGIANENLDCKTAFKVGQATAKVLAKESSMHSRFVIGNDGRISSDMLSCALISGLCSMGCSVTDLGTVPTPAVACLTEKYEADAGIVVSASHNSFEYNGIKIFNGKGKKLPDMLEEKIESTVFEGDIRTDHVSPNSIGRIIQNGDPIKDYTDHVKSTVSHSLTPLRIALDCSNGACSYTAERIFGDLGAELHLLNSSPNGVNINDSCGSTCPDALAEYVKAHGLDGGAAFDGDGDRCICVDENGNVCDGDKIMAICTSELLRKGKLNKSTVVGTVMTNLGLVKFFEKLGIRFIATKVGDKFVSEEMSTGDFVFGGEQSGHIIFGDYASTGDGQLTALQIFSIMCQSKKKLSDLASVMTPYPQYSLNVPTSANGKVHFFTDTDIERSIASAKEKLKDGRIVVRPSGTEPLIRIMAEGSDENEVIKTVSTLKKELCALIKKYD